jgi:2-(1,2-epoxy-1,2-dihydrophenyl)acetyl-CoA isomerase
MISYDIVDRVGVIELYDRDSPNALGDEDLASITGIAASAAEDAEVRAVLIIGRGRAFSAGGHLRKMEELIEADRLAVRDALAEWQKPLLALEALEKPVVAAVNGLCVAAGASIILACDLRIAARSARITFPSVNVGLVTDLGCTYRLPRIVGLGWAKHCLLTGCWIDAAMAERIGLVTAVFDDEGFRDSALSFVREQLTSKSASAQAVMKRLADRNAEAELASALESERMAQALLYDGADVRAAHKALSKPRSSP